MKIIKLLSALLILAFTAAPASAIVIDGDFGLGEWAGYYTEDDGVGSGGYVGPGWGGQAFDVEYLGLKLDGAGSMLYFGLQTGFDLKDGVTVGGTYYAGGDFALDTNNDGIYDYAIDFSVASDPTYYLYEVSEWRDVMYAAHAAANPFEYKTGSLVATFSGKYSEGVSANNVDGGLSYTLEGGFDLSLFSPLLYSGGPVTLHWTMSCGNDYLNVTSTPVPESGTVVALGTGLFGLFVIRRRLVRA